MEHMGAKYHYPNLTALMIFHHEWAAVETCLRSFKKFYPDGQIILGRDSLTPYVHENIKYLNPELLSKNDAMEKMIELNFDSRSLLEISNAEKFQIVSKQMDRMRECAEKSQNEYILALEYDALVRGKIKVFDGVDLETLSINLYSAELINLIESITHRKVNFLGWGFVVGVVSRSAVFEATKWFENNRDVMMDLISIDSNFVYLDFLMPILVFLSGGNVEDNGLTIECNRDRFWRYRKNPLLHQYRGGKVNKRFHRKYTKF